MKTITTSDINPRFLFILDMYGATERFITNRIANTKGWPKDLNKMENINEADSFLEFMYGSFVFKTTSEGSKYWRIIADQNEPKIKRLTKLLKK